jgi:transcriptional regulator with XRE-family HTH domain
MTRRREFKVNGNRVRELRTVRGFTVQELADRVGISRSYLGHLETGIRHTLTMGNAVRLAAALNVPTEEVSA